MRIGERVFVRVVRIPAGEAPEEVRKQWVGCSFVAVYRGSERVRGIMTGAPGLAHDVVAVEAGIAVQTLQQRSREAAQWFREHSRDGPSGNFLFDAADVEVIRGDSRDSE